VIRANGRAVAPESLRRRHVSATLQRSAVDLLDAHLFTPENSTTLDEETTS
jgi:hypothetical protein